MQYVKKFYTYIRTLRNEYDAVFVHMNQEYVLLGGMCWRWWGKKVFMWRNHHSGTILTDLAAAFCTGVFCTSKFSYTAKYKKTLFMPVGVDGDFFKKNPSVSRRSSSILFLGRIAPVKQPHILIEALGMLDKEGVGYTASIYGDALPKDAAYLESLKKRVVELDISSKVSFYGGIPNDNTPNIYSEHDIFVNLSSSGMYDKTIFEAAACECIVLASNENLRGLFKNEYILNQGDARDLAEKLSQNLPPLNRDTLGKSFRDIALGQSLGILSDMLASAINRSHASHH